MQEYDIVIIGQGPAGLSAAIYTARAGMKTLVLGCDPKVAGEYDIDNYFGFPEAISGKELIGRGAAQAGRFGAVLRCDQALAVHFGDDGAYIVKTASGEYRGRALVLATGVSRKKPGISNIDEYEGKGVSYCVSCDGFFFKGARVMVAGEGVFAANQALELKEYTPDVAICTLGKKPDIGPEYLRRLELAGIEIIEKKIESLRGEGRLEAARFDDGAIREVRGLFIALGDASSLDFAYSLGVITRGVFIETDTEQKTNVPGVFAAGDCTGRYLQISVAVGEGAVAARSAIAYVREARQGAP